MARLKEFYNSKIRCELMDEFNYKNILQVPRILKIVINMGVGSAVKDKKNIEIASKHLSLIAGQAPILTRARKSIAGFKLREGVPIGVKVTLRRSRMYEFLDRLVNVAMPRIRDFRGFSTSSFDGCGNFNFGIKEHIIFPEINYDTVDCIRGLDISIETSALTNKEGLSLMRCFNVPFTG
jgi:large subunit ribosomal protein L5